MQFNRLMAGVAGGVLTFATVMAGEATADTTSADDVTAMACYDTQSYFHKPTGSFIHPSTEWLTTTSSCNDINVKLDLAGEVKVCFENGGCQARYKWAPTGQWTAIATGVRDGSRYKLRFGTDGTYSGYIAD